MRASLPEVLEGGTGISAQGLAQQLRIVALAPSATVVIYSDTSQHALEAEDTLVKRGHFGIVNGGNNEELRDALFDHVSRPEDVPPGGDPTDDDLMDIN
ncbi:hypothetical protein RZO07_09360 [Pseudomonas protegens]|uniref:hypothetical protein n=1 Tax=Pseudomonas protegens TaxID=380021 RepID=UPI00293749EB|nr:hypothetical protein [Pseudomonas protegens]WOE81415.1 hypothetical protein RZO07_09360 [Pseudomonas protegens]